MPARSRVWPDPRVKPPYGAAAIDWSHPLADNLRALWLFGTSGAGEIDLCGRGQSMTITNGAVSGKGLDCNGATTNGTFANPSGGPLRFSSSDAKTAWAVLQAHATDGGNHGVLTNSAGVYPLYQYSANTWLCAWNGSEFASTSGTVVVGEWTSLVGTWNGTNVRLYKSKTLVQDVTPSPAGNTSGTYSVGSTGGVQNWDGVLSVLGIWGRALSHGHAMWLDAEPYAMLRPIVRRRYSVPATSTIIPLVMHHVRMSH